MIALLNESILWWHWIVLGLFLFILEINTGTFILLGFGLASIIVGILAITIELSFLSELSLWIVFCILTLGIWLKWFKPTTVSLSGQSSHTLDTLGMVTHEIHPHSRGKVTFDSPILGSTSWNTTAKVYIPINTRISIVKVNGQLIEVTPIN